MFRAIELRAHLFEIEVSEVVAFPMKLNLYYHLHCSKQYITFALIFSRKIQVYQDENSEITYDFSILH